MTLTSSRISDEFALIQEILARAEFGTAFWLYPTLKVIVHNDGWVDVTERVGGGSPDRYWGDTTRNAARIILRRYW